VNGSPRVAHITSIDLTLRVLLLPQLRRLRDEGYEVTGISAPGPSVRALEGEGIRHIAWANATRSWDLRADLRAFVELLSILRRERFDVVHTHNPKPGVMGRIAARMARVPHVVNTTHGLYATQNDRVQRKVPVLALEWLASRWSDVELFQSEEDHAWVRRIHLVRPSKSLVLGNGVDLARYDPGAVPPYRIERLRQELGFSRDAVIVGTVGRMVAEKGYRELFAAARRVSASAPQVAFLVVGPEDPEKSDALTARDLAGGGVNVAFAGWRDDVRDLLAMMDIFVLASWREGVPRSAIEAAAMGKPLVLTDIRGCREVARDGVEGILVPVRDPQRLGAAIASLVADPALRRRLGNAARARAVERFDERRVEEVIVAEYRRLLSPRWGNGGHTSNAAVSAPGRTTADLIGTEPIPGPRIRP
jgi:glycosyltransferase involved in cell wall biosynthesis